jgi:tetratricopeptide (TPR) repeat protein
MKRIAGIGAVVAVAVGAAGLWRLASAADECEAPYRLPILVDGSGVEFRDAERRAERNPASGLLAARYAAALLGRARATGDAAMLERAGSEAARSLALLPENDGATLVLAELAESRHDFEKAIALAEGILRRRPRDPGALAILVTANAGRGESGPALEAARALVAFLPTSGALTLRAIAREASGDAEGAMADLRAAIAKEDVGETTQSAWMRTLLGRLQLQRGRAREAKALFLESLRIRPAEWKALWHLGRAEQALGDAASAERHYAHAVKLSNEPPVMADLAGLLRSEGRGAEAEALYQRAIDQVSAEIVTTPYGHRSELARILLDRRRSEDVPRALALATADAEVRHDRETLRTLDRARAAR